MEYLAWNPKAKEVQVHLGSDGFHVTEGLSICFKWSVVWSSKSSRNPVSEGWTGRVCVWQHLLQQISQSGPRRAAISHVWRGVTGSSRAKDCLLALDKWKMLRWASSRRSNLPTPPSWMILMEQVDSSVSSVFFLERMMEVLKKWAVSLLSHLCWGLHMRSADRALVRKKMVASKEVYDVKRKQTFQFSWVVDYYYSAKEALCTNVPA